MQDNQLALLCEHYDNVVSALKKEIEKRDKFFLFILAATLGLMIQVTEQDLFTFILKRLTGISNENIIHDNIMSTLLWGITLFLFVRYSQICSTIEREYLYLRSVESEINSEFDGEVLFKLESNFYKNTKSHIRTTNKIIFKVAFPILLLSSILIKSYHEFFIGQFDNYTYLNLAMATLIIHNIFAFMIDINKGK